MANSPQDHDPLCCHVAAHELFAIAYRLVSDVRALHNDHRTDDVACLHHVWKTAGDMLAEQLADDAKARASLEVGRRPWQDNEPYDSMTNEPRTS